jgi:hypothetical protein
MKLWRCIMVVVLFLFVSTSGLTQADAVRQQTCETNPYKSTIDSLKSAFALQGYTLLRESSIMMQSEYEMPIIVPMNQGVWYQFVFIGDPSSRLYEVRMFDWNERQVVYQKKLWGDIDGNIISYRYIPQFSEYHMIKPLQINKKKKKLCGYVMLLKKTSNQAVAGQK